MQDDALIFALLFGKNEETKEVNKKSEKYKSSGRTLSVIITETNFTSNKLCSFLNGLAFGAVNSMDFEMYLYFFSGYWIAYIYSSHQINIIN